MQTVTSDSVITLDADADYSGAAEGNTDFDAALEETELRCGGCSGLRGRGDVASLAEVEDLVVDSLTTSCSVVNE
ncbi:hypothetical protein K7432_011226 [Basidiobolus ranarum]|uniref:Uncharacterized protein n=1 Tax=Basidiobolus ranarum TaxID=34480 RepID=A0ABR2VUR0_9FUNG